MISRRALVAPAVLPLFDAANPDSRGRLRNRCCRDAPAGHRLSCATSARLPGRTRPVLRETDFPPDRWHRSFATERARLIPLKHDLMTQEVYSKPARSEHRLWNPVDTFSLPAQACW